MMNKNIVQFFLVIVLIFATCCFAFILNQPTTTSPTIAKQFLSLDTIVEITVWTNSALKDDIDHDFLLNKLNEIENEVIRLEEIISIYNEESMFYKLNNFTSQEKPIEFNELDLVAQEVLLEAINYSKITNGKFNILTYPLMELWGFTTRNYKVPTNDEIYEILKLLDYKTIDITKENLGLTENMGIDLGGIAKGYIGDRITNELSEYVSSAVINLGGNIHVTNEKPDNSSFTIAVEYPYSDDYAGLLTLTNKAVVTSGNYQRYFIEDDIIYHHIMDTTTGYPANNGISSVTVVADKGVTADAYSTALMTMTLDDGIDFWRNNNDFEVLWIDTEGHLYITNGLEGLFQATNNIKCSVILD